MVEALVAPSGRDLTRTYMLSELSSRSITFPWSTEVPDPRPGRFATIEELNSRDQHGFFADSQLIQIRLYDTDGQRCAATARLVKGLWLVMPNQLIVQEVEHAGGPTRQKDPNVPSLERFLVTAWVTVMTAPA
jgi:hypothetical protein